jgi:hypothetical protein
MVHRRVARVVSGRLRHRVIRGRSPIALRPSKGQGFDAIWNGDCLTAS